MTNEGICLDSVGRQRAEDMAPSGGRNATALRVVQCADATTERQRWLWDARLMQLRPAGDVRRCATANATATPAGAELVGSVGGGGGGGSLLDELMGVGVKSTDRMFDVSVRECAPVGSGGVEERTQKWVLLPLPWR